MRATKNVFLDSQVFIGHNFNFASPSLKRLEELAIAGEANVFITDIIIREVEANVQERVKGFASSLKTLKRKSPILKALQSTESKDPTLDADQACNELSERFRDYRNRTQMTVLALNLASPTAVFDWYFDLHLPFKENTAKRKEFPDAFNMSILEKWCETTGEKIYVVSGDSDLREYCATSQQLLSLTTPGEYAHLYSTEVEALRIIEETTNQHIDEVEVAIGEAFENTGFVMDDVDGDIHGVTLGSIEINEISLLSAQNGIAKFEVDCRIGFKADIEYDDMETAIWDSDEKVSIPLHTIRCEVERAYEGLIGVDVALHDGQFEKVQDVQLERDITFSAIEDEYPYK
jgi:hypothetical protein